MNHKDIPVVIAIIIVSIYALFIIHQLHIAVNKTLKVAEQRTQTPQPLLELQLKIRAFTNLLFNILYIIIIVYAIMYILWIILSG